jgi:hypothetical protein
VYFPTPATTTAEQIADEIVANGWFAIADPTTATGESLAIALTAAGYDDDFPDPTIVTPEDIAIVLNADRTLGDPTTALRAWRAW